MLNHNHGDASKENIVPWWQEAASESQTRPLIQAAPEAEEVLLPEARDLGEELEEEARRRAVFTTEEIIVPADMAILWPWFRRIYGVIMFSLMTFVTASITMTVFRLETPISHSVLATLVQGVAILWAGKIGIYLLLLFQEKKVKKMHFVVSSEGVQFVSSHRTLGPIFWDEIAEIRPSRSLLWRRLGIIPKDPESLGKRLGGSLGFSLILQASTARLLSALSLPSATYAITLPVRESDLLAHIHYKMRGTAEK